MRNALDDRLRAEAMTLGADFFGVADLAPARDFIREQGGEMVACFSRALSIGVRMPSAIVDEIARHDDKTALIAYRSHSYEILNVRLNQIASRLASFLQREGYRAFPIAAAERADGETMRGLFSHKLAAHLAGLGWIGKSCLLVTPQVGPRARWVSVLTDAPLAPGQPVEERCGVCGHLPGARLHRTQFPRRGAARGALRHIQVRGQFPPARAAGGFAGMRPVRVRMPVWEGYLTSSHKGL